MIVAFKNSIKNTRKVTWYRFCTSSKKTWIVLFFYYVQVCREIKRSFHLDPYFDYLLTLNISKHPVQIVKIIYVHYNIVYTYLVANLNNEFNVQKICLKSIFNRVAKRKFIGPGTLRFNQTELCRISIKISIIFLIISLYIATHAVTVCFFLVNGILHIYVDQSQRNYNRK